MAETQPISRALWLRYGLISLVVVVLDQLTKYAAVARLSDLFATFELELAFADKLERFLWRGHPARTGAYTVLENFWHFRYVENPGAAWGFLSGTAAWFRTPFFLLVSLVAMVVIIMYFRGTTSAQTILRVALGMVFGGAIGNFLDRVRLGYVIDFIDWHWYNEATWPTFNIADSAISVGVALMFVDMLLEKRRAKSAAVAR